MAFTDWEISGEIARGAGGVVYAARRRKDGLACALKLLAADPRAEREIAILRRLDHPHIARLHDAGPHGSGFFHATDLASKTLVSQAPAPPARALELVAQLASALAHAHERGVLHRDLKPENVLVAADGSVRVTDFGLAKDEQAASITRTGAAVGTPLWSAPELVEGAREADARADVFGAGALLFFLLTGRPPFPARSLDELVALWRDGPPPHVDEALLGEPCLTHVNELLARTLAVARERRLGSAKEVEAALERARGALAATTQPVPAPSSSGGSSSGGSPSGVIPEKIGPYRVDSVLGKGGMGLVLAATDEQLGRRVAVKVLLDTRAKASRTRFAEEARAAALLAHPGIVQVYALAIDEEPPWIAMELVEGESLKERLERGPIDPREALALVAAIARAVAHAHEHGVLHRDLKPGNLLVDKQGRPKIADFGIARRVDRETLTQTGAAIGTPLYMAPEQAQGKAVAASDIYSLGAVLYELLTGRAPYQAENVLLLMQKLGGPIDAPSSLRPGIPRGVDDLCRRALSKDPDLRPRDANALADELERLLRGNRPSPLLVLVPVAVATVVAVAAVLARPRAAPPPVVLAAPPPPPVKTDLTFAATRDLKHERGSAAGTDWLCRATLDRPGLLAFGPSTASLGAGRWTASYRLALADERGEDLRLLTLEVRDAILDRTLARRAVFRRDLGAPGRFADVPLSFDAPNAAKPDLRVFWHGLADVKLEAVTLARGGADPVPLDAVELFRGPWVLEAERDLEHERGAKDGECWTCVPDRDLEGVQASGLLPEELPAAIHTAVFRLAVDKTAIDRRSVVLLDVYDATTGTKLGYRMIRWGHFDRANQLQDFQVEFEPPKGHRAEVRVSWNGLVKLRFDRVTVRAGPRTD